MAGANPEYKNAMRYLKMRDITKREILKYGIGYCVEGLYRYRIIIPSYTNDGTLNYFVGITLVLVVAINTSKWIEYNFTILLVVD